jgi:uracil-DNA glycosylase
MGFVLEGPDGAGKSTLATNLGPMLSYRVEHFGPPTKPPLKEYLHWLVGQDDQGHRMVIDRFHLGEDVYGPIFRHTKGLTKYELYAIEWALMIRGYSMIYVTQSLKTLVGNLEERGDDMVQVEQLTRISESYWRTIQRTIMPISLYDYHWPKGLPTALEQEQLHRNRSETYLDHMGHFWGTGSLQPKVVLVGERLNKKLNSANVPFSIGTSSEWLMDAVNHLNWEGRVYITNAVKHDGNEEMVAREIRWLRSQAFLYERLPPSVIALGTKASNVLVKHKIPHLTVVHPSYHRRFFHGHGPGSYAALLGAAIPTYLAAR